MTSRFGRYAIGVFCSASPGELARLCIFSLFVGLYSFSSLATAQSTNSFIAGLAPYERPANAPKLEAAPPDTVRSAAALHGVVEPVPPSITRFLKDQGGWYTPFSWPGMHDYYDIRGWHASPPPAGKS